MKFACLIIAVVLFAIDALTYFVPVTAPPYRHPGGRLQAAGLAFFAASFAVPS